MQHAEGKSERKNKRDSHGNESCVFREEKKMI